MVHRTKKSALLFPLLAAAAVSAANDWSVKCKGNCSYDTNGTKGRAFSTLNIASNSATVSDITSAASWELLDCPPDWSSGPRDVRLVCTADDSAAGGCDDLLEQGAVNTIVRLPENCGTGPFARVATWGVSDDQSIPTNSEAERKLKLRKRTEPPQVMQARLDWQLRSIPADRGTVTFDIKVANDPIKDDQIVARRSLRHMLHHKRFGFGDIIDKAKDIGGDIVDGAKEAAGAVGDAAKDAAGAVGGVVGDVVDGAKDAAGKVGDAVGDVIDKGKEIAKDINNIDADNSAALDTINIQKNIPIFNTNLACQVGTVGFDATIDVNVDADVQANVGFAFLMKGTIVPPDVADFGLAVAMSGKAKATFNIDAFLQGDVSIGPISIFDVGIPGISFPGILNLGPQFALKARGVGFISMDMSMQIPVTWDFPQLAFAFPPEKAKAAGDGQESKNTANLEMSFRPGTLSGSLEFHIIPELQFGIDAIGGFATAEIFAGVDGDATLNLDATINPDFSMDGCSDMSLGLNINAGARGTFLKFFNQQTAIPIFQKRVPIFKKCFGSGDGPASALLDNGDGTFTNSLGDLVNERGELIDETGQVIPDADAIDLNDPSLAPAEPVLDEAGNPIPEDQLVFANDDGTFETADGQVTNDQGELLDSTGAPLGCELDLSAAVDENGDPIPPEEVLIPNEDGTFSDGNCNIVDVNGQPVDTEGNVLDLEPITDDATGETIPPDEVVFDNGDGTFSDAFGNPVDEFGGAIDFDEEGNVIPVDVAPQPDLTQPTTQTEDEAEVTTDPDFVIKTPDEVKAIAEALVRGQPLPSPPATPPADAPPADAPPADAPPADAPPADAPPAKRSMHQKRAFGCTPSFIGPTTGGLFAPPITGVGQLTRFF